MKVYRLISVWVAAAVLAHAAPADARKVMGAELPEPLSPVAGAQGAHFIVQKPFNKALKDLRRTYDRMSGVVIRRISTPPRVRAFVVENTRARRTWDAINLYEDLRSGTVYLTVLAHRRSR